MGNIRKDGINMRKPIFALFLFLALAIFPVSANESMSPYRAFTATALNGTATIRSIAYPLQPYKIFGFWVQGISASGKPDFRVYYEVAPFNEEAMFAVPDRARDIFEEINDEDPHIEAFSPPPMMWIKIVVEGIGTNPSDTKITGVLCLQ